MSALQVARTFGFRLSVCHGFSTQADAATGDASQPATAAPASTVAPSPVDPQAHVSY